MHNTNLGVRDSVLPQWPLATNKVTRGIAIKSCKVPHVVRGPRPTPHMPHLVPCCAGALPAHKTVRRCFAGAAGRVRRRQLALWGGAPVRAGAAGCSRPRSTPPIHALGVCRRKPATKRWGCAGASRRFGGERRRKPGAFPDFVLSTDRGAKILKCVQTRHDPVFLLLKRDIVAC